jgi:EmrB/QacA subfamily drug resistance transporter
VDGLGPGTTRQQRLLLVGMALSMSIWFIDDTAVTVALPTIERHFDVSSTAAQWTVTAYLLAAAAGVAAAGRLADTFGRRRVFLVGVVTFMASSMLCGLAATDWWLIAARVLQGGGAALMGPAAVALITTSFPPERRGRALGTVAAAASVALALGPLVGGAIVEGLGWRWIFFLNVPVAALVIVLVHAAAPDSRDEAVGRVDVRGVVLLTAGLCALVLGLAESPAWGFGSALTIGLLVGAAGCLAVFGLVESRIDDPLIHLRVLRHPHVLVASTIGLCNQFVVIALAVFAITYFQVSFGLSPLEAGLLFLPTVLPQAVTARLAGRLADTVGPAIPIIAGMATMAIAMAWVSYGAEHHSYLTMIPPMVAFGIGIALVVTPTRVAAQAAVGEEHQGVVAGVMSTFNRVGAVLGVALVGALIVALQHTRTIELLARDRISPDRDDRAALDSILYHGHRGSTALADDPSRFLGPVRHAADNAFSYAFANGMRVGAIVAAAAAVLGLLLLRSSRPLRW